MLEAQYQQMRPARWSDLRCVVIEALLSSCHRRRNAEHVIYVGDIAADVAAILTGRGETSRSRTATNRLRITGTRPEREARS